MHTNHQGRIQESALGRHIRPSLPSPPLPSPFNPPFPSLPFPFPPVPSSPILSLFLPSFPLPLEVSPCFAARGSGGALKLPQRVRAEPGRQTVFGELYRLKIAPVVAMVTKDTST